MAIKKVVDVRNEGSALAAQCHVSGTKIGDGGYAGAGRDDGAFTDLKSRGGRLTEMGRRLTLMEDRLAVIANEIDALKGDLEPFAGSKDRVGVNVPKAEIQLAQFSSRNRLLLGYAKNFLAQRGRKLKRSMAEQLGAYIWRRPGDAS